jgi:hypothetical protein
MLLEIGRGFNNHDGDHPWRRDLAGVVTVAEIYKVRKEIILKEQDHSRKGLSESQNRTHSEFALRHQLTSKMDYTTTTANKGLYFRVDEDRQPCGFNSEA